MHIAKAQPFRCHYRRAVPGQAPHALFVQLRARDAQHAQQLAEHALDVLVDRVEPAPIPTTTDQEV